MGRKGYHGNYLGGHTIIRTHPVGLDKSAKKRQLLTGLNWADRSKDGGKPAIFVNELMIIDATGKLTIGAAKRHSSKWLLHKRFMRSAECVETYRTMIGVGLSGFSAFYVKTKTKMAKFRLGSSTEVAKLLNEANCKTYHGQRWNSKSVEMFLCIWAADVRTRLQAQIKKNSHGKKRV
jgi:hypothetical protein